jgi:membrane-bound ClpP family serine protease
MFPPQQSLVLLVAYYLLLLVEFFVPSGGILGVAAFLTGLSAIITAWMHHADAGLTVLALITVTTPLIIVSMIRVWPNTTIGRMILNRQPGQLAQSTATQRRLPDGRLLRDLEGCIGIALTNLLPSGLIQIDNLRLDAVSVGIPIDAGTRVVVTKIQAGKVQVRPALEHEQGKRLSNSAASPTSPAALDTDLNELALEPMNPDQPQS